MLNPRVAIVFFINVRCNWAKNHGKETSGGVKYPTVAA